MGTALTVLSAVTASISSPPQITGTTGPWRPANWQPALTMTATDPTTQQQTAYVFDGEARIEHSQQTEITKNPIQTGSALTDHAYLIPATVFAEIWMSDVMQSYTVGQWSDGPSRGVSAYQTLRALQAARTPITLATRLWPYNTMLIKSVVAPDDKETKYGLRVLVTFEEIITANVQATSASSNSVNNSTRPQSTALTTVGQTQTQPVPPAVTAQNNIASNPTASANTPAVPGSGNWSSYSVTQLNGIIK